MDKYKYKIKEYRKTMLGFDHVVLDLNRLGEDGWELVSVIQDKYEDLRMGYFFKKKIK